MLHEAVRAGFLPVVRYLIDAGADVSVKTSGGDLPLDIALNHHGEEHGVTLHLINIGAPYTED